MKAGWEDRYHWMFFETEIERTARIDRKNKKHKKKDKKRKKSKWWGEQWWGGEQSALVSSP